MSDVTCIEVALLVEGGSPPIAAEGPMSLFCRTGRWTVLRAEGLDLLPLDEGMKRQVRASGQMWLEEAAYNDFFGNAMEGENDPDQNVRLQER